MTNRRVNDFYETGNWQVDALTDHLPELSGSILCPCVGDGSLLRRLRANRPNLGRCVTNDIDATREAHTHFDATAPSLWNYITANWRPDWIVENPPFNVEIDILKRAYEAARVGVVFMSRISFLEPTGERGPWLSEHPASKTITLERYSFTGNGKSDSTTTQWVIWSKVPLSGPAVISAYGYKHGRRATTAIAGTA